jgi:hypothetical protein
VKIYSTLLLAVFLSKFKSRKLSLGDTAANNKIFVNGNRSIHSKYFCNKGLFQSLC